MNGHRIEKRLDSFFTPLRVQCLIFMGLMFALQVSLAQDSCNVNCGDKCTRVNFGIQFRNPVCEGVCEAEKAAAPLTNCATLPDPWAIAQKLALDACGVPHFVTLQYISSVCGFTALNPGYERKIQGAKEALVQAGLVQDEEFRDVSISFCNAIHGGGVVPDRDRVFLHNSATSANVIKLASLLAHEMEHVRQYRRQGTDAFKCDYTGQMGSCLISNANRGYSNLLRDNFCQSADQNRFERDAYQAEARAMNVLTSQVQRTGSRTLSVESASTGSPKGDRVLYCQMRRDYCSFVGGNIGESCVCRRTLPTGVSGLTRSGGMSTDMPTGTSWD